ncbi:hypothetical protein FRB93_009325 [Tulasnella sp. JGI-2019a]|nr:hypothetical protein FRB93_009325 [Tulasnella sp. JGI-2019a]
MPHLYSSFADALDVSSLSTTYSRRSNLTSADPDPRKSPHPDGGFMGLTLAPLLALAVLCLLFILYRRAASIKYIIGTRLNEWTGQEGQVRLSEDNGPSAQSFVVNDQLEDEDDDVVTPLGKRSPQPPEDGFPR